MVSDKTKSVKVEVEVPELTQKLKALVLQLATASDIELTEEQLELTDTNWNELVNDDGKIEIDGNDYITLNELRRLARLRGYVSSRPNVVQVPEYENHRQTTVEWEIVWGDGIVDGAAADASWRTCNPGFRNFTVAIASNRAEARCIRSALAIETCSLEEIGPDDEDLSGPANDQQKGAIPMLLERYKLTSDMFAELFGDDIASKITEGDTVNVSGITHQDAVKILAAINKRKK